MEKLQIGKCMICGRDIYYTETYFKKYKGSEMICWNCSKYGKKNNDKQKEEKIKNEIKEIVNKRIIIENNVLNERRIKLKKEIEELKSEIKSEKQINEKQKKRILILKMEKEYLKRKNNNLIKSKNK